MKLHANAALSLKGRLVERHRKELEQFCYLMLGDRHDAKGALEETVLCAWREREFVEPIATYGCGCIGSRCASALRIFASADEFTGPRSFDLVKS